MKKNNNRISRITKKSPSFHHFEDVAEDELIEVIPLHEYLDTLITSKGLKKTGHPMLYARIERDSAIIFSIEHQLSLTDLNELLYELGYDLLE